VIHTVTTVNYQPVISSPKTKRSRRVVYLDNLTVASLKAHRARQVIERTDAGPDWCTDIDLVFRDEFSRVLNPDWFSRQFARLVRGAGRPKIRLHDLRHGYATLALKAGVHPKIISERLGHATINVTLGLYSHVSPAIERDVAERLSVEILGEL
jgi:integrase